MKINTRLIITFILFFIVPTSLVVGSYLVLRNVFGFLIVEKVEINGQTSFAMSQESLLSALIVIFCVIVLTGIVLVNWLMYGFIKPINQLKKALHSIENGDYDTSLIKPKQAEFEGLFKDFESMRIKLKENRDRRNLAEKQNKELIANITHDLKTPITSIRGYVEGIMDGVADTDEKMDRYIKTIYNKANALNALINELTGYSKIDAREITYNFGRISVDEYFGDCASEMIFDLQEQGVKFVYDNRVKKRDNGMGIPKEDTEKIFDRFFRSDVSRNSDKGGNGIGLSIAKKIIEDHGGRIWATVDGSVGLTIHFTLRKYTDEIMADYTKEPDQINIDIENVAYADEEEKKILPEDPELKDSDSSDGLTEEKVEKYSEVINMLGDFEDEN